MAGLERDDSKRRHSFCQIGIAHGARPKLGLGHSYSYGYRLASGTWAKAKAGAQLQVSIWDMGQGQSWGTVTVSVRLASETWSKAKAGAQYSFSQVSFWDMARAGQGTAQFQSNSSSYLRGPAANFVCPSYMDSLILQTLEELV